MKNNNLPTLTYILFIFLFIYFILFWLTKCLSPLVHFVRVKSLTSSRPYFIQGQAKIITLCFVSHKIRKRNRKDGKERKRKTIFSNSILSRREKLKERKDVLNCLLWFSLIFLLFHLYFEIKNILTNFIKFSSLSFHLFIFLLL